MKHLLILLSLILLSFPVIGQETGVLFLREVNDKWGWFEDGNKDKDAKYIGEFKDGFFEDRQPNGQGTITYPNGRKYVGEWKDGLPNGQGTITYPSGSKYVGEWKDGVRNGQGTYTQYGSLLYPDGRKYVGEYKNGKEWNGTYYDNNGKKEYKLVNGEIE